MSSIAEIREILSKSNVPLSTADILEELGLEGASREEKKPVYSAIQNGVLAGHFTRHHSSEGLEYSVAAQGESGYGERARTGGKRGPKPKAKAAQPTDPPAVRPDALIDVAAPPPPAYGPADVAFKRAPPKPSDFDLRRRLDAIGTDIADAIADACDAEHPHALIKALVVSREAVSRAQAALPQ